VRIGAPLDLRLLTPRVASTYAAVLRAVPDSRLLLGNREELSEAVCNRALELFADNGVIDRVDVDPLDDNPNDSLVVRRLRYMVSIDIYLESFPVSAPMPAIGAKEGKLLSGPMRWLTSRAHSPPEAAP